MSDGRRPAPEEIKTTDLISCTECRRIKRKCDRQTPCNNCVSRGKPDLCVQEVRKYPPSVSRIESRLEDVEARLQSLESILGTFQQQQPQGALLQQPIPITPLSESAAALVPPAAPAYVSMNDLALNSSLFASASTPSLAAAAELPNVAAEPPVPVVQPERPPDLEVSEILANFHDLDKWQPEPELYQPASPFDDLYPSIVSTRAPKSSAWWNCLMEQIFNDLPAMHLIHSLVELYFKHTGWQIIVVHQHQFYHELKELEAILAKRKENPVYVDPAWFATLFMMLSLAVYHEYEATGHILGYTDPGHVESLAQKLALSSQDALIAADWVTEPNLRVVQTLLIRGWWSQHAEAQNSLFEARRTTQASIVGICFSHCQALGLTELGRDSKKMPKPDAGLGSTQSGWRRQMALRILFGFHVLLGLTGSRRPAEIDDYETPALVTDDRLGWDLQVAPTSFWTDSLLIARAVPALLNRHGRSFDKLVEKPGLQFESFTNCSNELETQMESLAAIVRMKTNFQAPSVAATTEGFLIFLQLFCLGPQLRIMRLLLSRLRNSPTSTGDRLHQIQDKAYSIAERLIKALSRVEGKVITLRDSMAVPFLLSACVVLIHLAGLPIGLHERLSLGTELCITAIGLLTQAKDFSRNKAIASNAASALAALDSLLTRMIRLSVANEPYQWSLQRIQGSLPMVQKDFAMDTATLPNPSMQSLQSYDLFSGFLQDAESPMADPRWQWF